MKYPSFSFTHSSTSIQQWMKDRETCCLLRLLPIIRQDVAGALQQVVSEEEPSERVLDPTAHLHQVLENVLTRLREGADVDHAHCDQQIAGERRAERRASVR